MDKKKITWISVGCCLILATSLFFRQKGSSQDVEDIKLWLSGSSQSKSSEAIYASFLKQPKLDEKTQIQALQKLLLDGKDCSFFSKVKNPSLVRLFSEISCKVSRGDLAEALKDSLALNKKLEACLEDQSYLYVLNLYRMTILHKKLGNQAEEKECLLEFGKIAKDPLVSISLKEAYYTLVENLRSEDVTLEDYFAARLGSI